MHFRRKRIHLVIALTYRYSRTQEKISGSSSGRSIRLLCASRNWPLQAVAKNGDAERTSSWAAKSRPSLPTVKVTIGEVRVLCAHASVSFHALCDNQAAYL